MCVPWQDSNPGLLFQRRIRSPLCQASMERIWFFKIYFFKLDGFLIKLDGFLIYIFNIDIFKLDGFLIKRSVHVQRLHLWHSERNYGWQRSHINHEIFTIRTTYVHKHCVLVAGVETRAHPWGTFWKLCSIDHQKTSLNTCVCMYFNTGVDFVGYAWLQALKD
jgi:hypothetical protein